MEMKERKTRVRLSSVKINKDVWFYVNRKSFDFVVWVNLKGGERVAAQFRVPFGKVREFLALHSNK